MHPRQAVRTQIQNAIEAIPAFLPVSSIVVGGANRIEDSQLPICYVILAGETETLLNSNFPQNDYSRDLTVFVLLKTKNKDRIDAIIECEDYARQVEDSLLKPNSIALSDLIKSISYSSFEISEPRENDPTFSVQLSFSVKYIDSFLRS
ncbi:MAG: hypothetical protein GY718_04475 [Lentisphaerae bacterium]|nr:hypothetical protein [Lentisphaerota bacterium]MCP4140710.1 hypothetical protein [Chloroflexota bacterium]